MTSRPFSAEALAGKVCIVTGGASGIGYATVKAFLQAGAKGVTIVDLSADAINRSIDALAKELGADIKERLHACAGDVSQEETAERYVKETIRQFGRLDISVQCAGISLPSADVADLKVSDWDKTMGVNLRGVFLGVQQSIRGILEVPRGEGQGGDAAIVLVSSQLGLDGYAGSAAYSASKFALRGLMSSVAQEVGPKGIRVNAVCPGPIETPMLEGFSAEGHLTKGNIKRAGKAEEVANAILFLASEASSYMCGSSLKVDAGWSKWC